MLEIIAMATMLIDHIGAVFFPDVVYLRIIGRIAFPLYCFMLVRGFHHTSNFQKYLLRLGLLAIVSQPIYSRLFGEDKLNVIFTLAACLIILKLVEKPKIHYIIMSLLLTLVLATGLFEYGAYAVLMVLIYRFIKDPPIILLAHAAANLAYNFYFAWVQHLSILGSIIIVWSLQESHPEVKINRSVYRLFYPVHMLCLLAVKSLM